MKKRMKSLRQMLVLLLTVAILFTDNSIMTLAAEIEAGTEEATYAEEQNYVEDSADETAEVQTETNDVDSLVSEEVTEVSAEADNLDAADEILTEDVLEEETLVEDFVPAPVETTDDIGLEDTSSDSAAEETEDMIVAEATTGLSFNNVDAEAGVYSVNLYAEAVLEDGYSLVLNDGSSSWSKYLYLYQYDKDGNLLGIEDNNVRYDYYTDENDRKVYYLGNRTYDYEIGENIVTPEVYTIDVSANRVDIVAFVKADNSEPEDYSCVSYNIISGRDEQEVNINLTSLTVSSSKVLSYEYEITGQKDFEPTIDSGNFSFEAFLKETGTEDIISQYSIYRSGNIITIDNLSPATNYEGYVELKRYINDEYKTIGKEDLSGTTIAAAEYSLYNTANYSVITANNFEIGGYKVKRSCDFALDYDEDKYTKQKYNDADDFSDVDSWSDPYFYYKQYDSEERELGHIKVSSSTYNYPVFDPDCTSFQVVTYLKATSDNSIITVSSDKIDRTTTLVPKFELEKSYLDSLNTTLSVNGLNGDLSEEGSNFTSNNIVISLGKSSDGSDWTDWSASCNFTTDSDGYEDNNGVFHCYYSIMINGLEENTVYYGSVSINISVVTVENGTTKETLFTVPINGWSTSATAGEILKTNGDSVSAADISVSGRKVSLPRVQLDYPSGWNKLEVTSVSANGDKEYANSNAYYATYYVEQYQGEKLLGTLKYYNGDEVTLIPETDNICIVSYVRKDDESKVYKIATDKFSVSQPAEPEFTAQMQNVSVKSATICLTENQEKYSYYGEYWNDRDFKVLLGKSQDELTSVSIISKSQHYNHNSDNGGYDYLQYLTVGSLSMNTTYYAKVQEIVTVDTLESGEKEYVLKTIDLGSFKTTDKIADLSIGKCNKGGKGSLRFSDVNFVLAAGYNTAVLSYDAETETYNYRKSEYDSYSSNYRYVYVKMYEGENYLGMIEKGFYTSNTAFVASVFPNTDNVEVVAYVYDEELASISENDIKVHSLGKYDCSNLLSNSVSVNAVCTEQPAGALLLTVKLSGMDDEDDSIDIYASKNNTFEDSADKINSHRLEANGTHEIAITKLDAAADYYVEFLYTYSVDNLVEKSKSSQEIELYKSIIGPFTTGEDKEIDMTTIFPDEALRNCIYDVLGKDSADTIMQSDLNRINVISYSNESSKIQSLKGIENLNFLQLLELNGQNLGEINDVDFSSMKYLNSVSLEKCGLTKVPDLSATSIKSCNFNYNYIKDTKSEVLTKLPGNVYFDYQEFRLSQVAGDPAIILNDTYYENNGSMPLYIRVDNVPFWEDDYVVKYSIGDSELTEATYSGYDYNSSRIYRISDTGVAADSQQTVKAALYGSDGTPITEKEMSVTFAKETLSFEPVKKAIGDSDAYVDIEIYGDYLGEKSTDDIKEVSIVDGSGNKATIPNYIYNNYIQVYNTSISDTRYPDSFQYLDGYKISGIQSWNTLCSNFHLLWNRNSFTEGNYDLQITFSDDSTKIVKNVLVVGEPQEETKDPIIYDVSVERYDSSSACLYLNINGGDLLDDTGALTFSLSAYDGSAVLPLTELGNRQSNSGVLLKLSVADWEDIPENVTFKFETLEGAEFARYSVVLQQNDIYNGYYNNVNGTYVCYVNDNIADGTELTAVFSQIDDEEGLVKLCETKATVSGGQIIFVPAVDGQRVNIISLLDTTFISYGADIQVEVQSKDDSVNPYRSTFEIYNSNYPTDGYMSIDNPILDSAETLSVRYSDYYNAASDITYEVEIVSSNGVTIVSGNLTERSGGSVTNDINIKGLLFPGYYDVNLYYEGIKLDSRGLNVYPASPFAISSVNTELSNDENGYYIYVYGTNLTAGEELDVSVTTLAGANKTYKAVAEEGNGLNKKIRIKDFSVDEYSERYCYVKITKAGVEPIDAKNIATNYYSDSRGKVTCLRAIDGNGEKSIGFDTTYRGLYRRVYRVYGYNVELPLTVKIYNLNDTKVIKTITVTENNYSFTEEDLSGLDILNNYYDITVTSADGYRSVMSNELLYYSGMDLSGEIDDDIISHEMLLLASKGGKITLGNKTLCSDGAKASNYVFRGNDVTYQFEASTGYYIKDVMLDGISIGAYDSLTLNNVLASHRIYVLFTTDDTEVVAPKVDEDSNPLNVTTGEGEAYEVSNEIGGNNPPGEEEEVKKYYSISITKNAGGSILSGTTVVGTNVKVVEKSSKTFSIKASTGYYISAVKVNGKEIAVTNLSSMDYTFANVTANQTLAVTFSKLEADSVFTIITSVSGNGSIIGSPVAAKDGKIEVIKGKDETVTFTPASGYKLESAYVDGAAVSGNSYTFKAISANHAVSANFVKDSSASDNNVSNNQVEKFTISVAVTNGTAEGTPVALSDNKAAVEKGSNETITFKSGKDNYVLTSLKVDGQEVTKTLSYEFKSVSANHSIEAVFDKEKVSVKFSDGSQKELVVGEPYGSLPAAPAISYQVFDGWYNEKGEKITADSIVKASDGTLTARYANIAIVVKQKVNIASYFKADLDAYMAGAAKPKYKYIVHTVESADGKLLPNTKKSDNKLGSVVTKTGVFTAKKAGKAAVVLATYDAATKQYVEGKTTLIIDIEKPVVKKQTLTYAGQTAYADEYCTYQYAEKIGHNPNYTDVVYTSSKPEVISVDPKTGKITALKSGSAKISIVSTLDIGAKKPSVVKTYITVSVKIPKFSKSVVTMKAGKTKKTSLSNVIKSLETVTWKSADTGIATVDETGKVTAVTAGTTKIIATVSSPDGTKTDYSYDLTVTQ